MLCHVTSYYSTMLCYSIAEHLTTEPPTRSIITEYSEQSIVLLRVLYYRASDPKTASKMFSRITEVCLDRGGSSRVIMTYIIPYHTIPYHTIPCYTILHYTILYYTVIYYLYYTMIYDTIRYNTILYYTTLYYTIIEYDI